MSIIYSSEGKGMNDGWIDSHIVLLKYSNCFF